MFGLRSLSRIYIASPLDPGCGLREEAAMGFAEAKPGADSWQ
jgi:hypothetical protein